MTLRPILAGAAFLACLAVPSLAAAAPGFATGNVNMRAGPGTEYPVITTIYAGSDVEIIGCLGDWGWCDVGWEGVRGWVAGNYLQAVYQQQRVYLPTYAPRVGLPVISFSFGYWDTHYRSRPFYRDRERWRDRWERRDDRQDARRDRREDRQEVRQERRREQRPEARQERRQNRPEARQERRQNRPEARQERRQNRPEARQERRQNRPEARQERRQNRPEARQERRQNRPEARQERRQNRSNDNCTQNTAGVVCR